MIQIITSILLGSSLSQLFTPFLVSRFGLNFFKIGLLQKIPSLSSDLAISKTIDLLDFVVTCSLSVIVYLVSKYLYQNKDKAKQKLTVTLNLFFGSVVFLQTHFITSSTKSLILLILFYTLFTVILSKSEKVIFDFKFSFLNLSNGLFFGLAIFLFSKSLTTSIAIPATLFFVTVFMWVCLKFFHSETFASRLFFLFVFLLLLPQQPVYLFFAICVISLPIRYLKSTRHNQFIEKYLYPISLIFIFSYNFRYYVGNFDSVEEGFWLGWFYRLATGQVLYRDVAVYHPPLLIWLGYFFQKIFGFSVANTRLFFHLLQISAMIIFYFVSEKLLKSKIIRFGLVFLISAITSTLVRNNVEIRLAVGLLSFFFLGSNLLLAGLIAAVSLMTSLEVGLAVIITSLLVSKFSKNFIIGLALGLLPFALILLFQGAMFNFFEQVSFYAQSFSAGYFNTPVDRAISMSHLHWHIFYQYLSSTPLFWELSRGTLLLGLVYFWKKGEFYGLVFSVFGLLIFRAALGRSDYYHLLFPFIVSIFVLLKLAEEKKTSVIVFLVLLLLTLKSEINSVYLENLLYRFQTFGFVAGDYQSLGGGRGGILVDKETLPIDKDKLYNYLKNNTKDTDTIFAYPWSPEIYFLAERKNATSIDTPYAFYDTRYQEKIISELQENPPVKIIYGLSQNFGNLSNESLPLVNKYIQDNYQKEIEFGTQLVLSKK